MIFNEIIKNHWPTTPPVPPRVRPEGTKTTFFNASWGFFLGSLGVVFDCPLLGQMAQIFARILLLIQQ